MIALLMLIALACFVYAFILFLKAVFYLLKAAFYICFANEKQVDEGFKKYVIKPTDEYQKFEDDFDDTIDDIINPKNIRL